MSENYQSKRERRQHTLETILENLREHVCRRNAEHHRSLGAIAKTKPAPVDDLQHAVQEMWMGFSLYFPTLGTPHAP